MLAAAYAAPVVCDAQIAAARLDEARIDEARAPFSHPELVPGLALASPDTDETLRGALRSMCAPSATLSLAGAESWVSTEGSAHTFLLTRSEPDGCALVDRTVAISVAVRAGERPRYRLRSTLPLARAPVGACDVVPVWREEVVLQGEGGPVRLILARDHVGDAIVHSEVLVRAATPEGWTQQTLLVPAPPRLLDGGEGPLVELTERDKEPWVVAHGDRTGAPPDCAPRPGHTVWTPGDDGAWVAHTGRRALDLLAGRGLWRMAGSDGWMLIVGQEDEDERDRLERRARRLQSRTDEPLRVLPSAAFPGLNPGFLILTPPPWPTEAEAAAAHRAWRPYRQAYVKQAWAMDDPCDD